tara:strand:+ start:2046 stop:3947 length:1902 start_codon:yes stop_codon:yes gene_type:complete
MSHQSDLISNDINAYLAQHERKQLLRLLTCGSVDDGKSTLIGRLLHDSKMIYEDHLASIAAESAKSGTTDGDLDLSLLVDGLQAEREQGITIDVAYRYFSTARRKFIIADTPGHEQYTRNMATGASTCALAIILIDARNGVQIQTRRHSFITSLLGIKHVIVAINKMDLVDYEESIFNKIREEFIKFSGSLPHAYLHFIPLSALTGVNVVQIGEEMPWYKGKSLMEILESVEIEADRNYIDFRFPVQYVNRPNSNFRGYCGTVASGVIRKGDKVTVLPSMKTSNIKSIVTYDEEIELAHAEMAITLTLEDELDISRGDMLVHPNNLPTTQSSFNAKIVWMTEKSMRLGKEYDLKLGAKTVAATINTLFHKIDVNTLQEKSAESLELNEIGLVEVNLFESSSFDSYEKNRATGCFILIDKLTNVTIAAGMIEQTARIKNQKEENYNSHVSKEERAARYGQTPATIMFIGLSGSGKSTLAHGLERRLFDKGHIVTVLDGKAMRLGISKNLSHDAKGRAENLKRSAHIAKFLNDSGVICCASFVAPNNDSREHAINVVGSENCFIVYCNPPVEICIKRDPSGLYAAFEENKTDIVPGLSFPYEKPERVDLELDTSSESIDASLNKITLLLENNLII